MVKKYHRENKDTKHDQPIGKYMFPSNVVDKMKESIKKTENTDKEHAFTLCSDKYNRIYNGKEHTQRGNNKTIKFESECRERGHIPVGTFHTHITTESSEPSALDVHSNCHKQNNVSCIGSPVDNKITCMLKNEETDCQYKVQSLLDDENKLIETNQGNYEELYSNVSKVVTENFKIGVLK